MLYSYVKYVEHISVTITIIINYLYYSSYWNRPHTGIALWSIGLQCGGSILFWLDPRDLIKNGQPWKWKSQEKMECSSLQSKTLSYILKNIL